MEQHVPVLEAAAEYYSRHISTDVAALAWLSRRGITAATAAKFRIGVCREGIVEAMRAEGIGLDLLLAVGLCRRDPDGCVHEVLANRVTIPNGVLGLTRQVWGCAMEPDQTPMYLVGDRRFLFNEDRGREADDISLVESIPDALLLEQQGISSVATCGLEMTDVYWRLHEARRVRVRFHPDRVGIKATAELTKLLGPIAVRE